MPDDDPARPLTPDGVAQALAARHAEPAEPAPESSLVAYAESLRAGGWSLRSALVRLAQPEPSRASAVLELVRRTDGALHGLTRALERATVVCDRGLRLDALDAPPVKPYPDARVADLARACAAAGDAAHDVAVAYDSQVGLTAKERDALPLLLVAVRLDAVAELLVAWAPTAPAAPPVDELDRRCTDIAAHLDALGVQRERGQRRRAGR